MLELLKGRTIQAVYVGAEEETLFLVTNTGVVCMSLYGDCCSQTWFSDIYNFDALLGQVAEAKEIDMPEYNVNDDRGRQEEDVAYGIEITTDKGTAKIVFRNSSNGYYGGNLEELKEFPALPDGLKQITDDWKA